MALGVPTQLATATANAATTTTGSFTAANGERIYAPVVARRGSATTPNKPAISDTGLGLTWVEVPGSDIFTTTGTIRIRMVLFTAVGNGNTGTVTGSSTSATSIGLVVDNYPGAADASANIVTGTDAAGSPSVTLAAVAGTSGALGYTFIGGSSAVSPPSGYTELSEAAAGSGILETAYDNSSPGLTLAWTSTSGVNAVAIAMEIVMAASAGAVAATEANDTLTATGSLSVNGTLTKTEAGDTLTATGSLSVNGTLAATEAGDTLTATGTMPAAGGVLAATEANDTLAATGSLQINAVLAKTEASDTLTAAGSLSIRGTLAITEAGDTVGAAGSLKLNAALAATEQGDTLSAAGSSPRVGSLAATEANDTAAATGSLRINAALAKTEEGDTLLATGRLSIRGTLTKTEAGDTLAAEIRLVVVANPDIDGPVAERVYIVESVLTKTYYLPPGDKPPPPTAAASWEAVGAFPRGGRGFEADDVGTSTQPPYEFKVANFDFATRPSDPDRPSEWWDGRLTSPGDLTRAISLTSVGSGAVESAGGTIVIDNTDGEFDAVLDDFYAVSQQVAIRHASPYQNWIDFETLWLVRITGVGTSENELTLEVADPVSYAQNYFPVTYYNGLGGIAGDASLINVQRPIVLGRVWNYKPLLIDPVKLIYQMHDGPILAVTGVFDGGAALAFHATYASYALMAAATIPAGKYGQCDSEGCIRLGGSPARDVTVHMDGAAAAGITVRSIASWLATQLEPQIWVEIETAAFALLPAAQAGWVWTEPFSYQEALSRFVGDVGWVWGSLQLGPLTVGQLLPPDDTGIVREYDETDVLKLERLSLPAGYESTHHRRIVHYHKNWTVQPQAQQVVTAVEPSYRQQEWRTVLATSAVDARNALDAPVLDTSLNGSADAQALADALIDLHGERRKLFSLQTKIFGEVPPLTSNVRVTYPRFALDGGKPFRVISLKHDFREGLATMLLWG